MIILLVGCIAMASACSWKLQETAPSHSGAQTNEAFQKGNQLYYQVGDFENALAAYQLVPKGSPNYATAQRYIGYNIYGREWGRWEEGLPFLEEAYRVAPSDPKVLEDIGRAYVKVGKITEGVDLLKKANTGAARRALDALE